MKVRLTHQLKLKNHTITDKESEVLRYGLSAAYAAMSTITLGSLSVTIQHNAGLQFALFFGSVCSLSWLLYSGIPFVVESRELRRIYDRPLRDDR